MRLPSKNTLCARLALNDADGLALRKLLQTCQSRDYIRETLSAANDIIHGYGVVYAASAQDTMYRARGLEYVNMGDPYAVTLIYDHSTGRFTVGAWGDIVETQPKRFQ